MRARSSFERMLALVLLGFTFCVVAGGSFFFNRQKGLAESAAEVQLNAIADLKATQLERWRRERIDDANLIRGNPLTIAAVKYFLADPLNGSARDPILLVMQNLEKNGHYARVALLDARQEACLSIPPGTQQWISQRDQAWAQAMGRDSQACLDDLVMRGGQTAVMKLFVPLFDKQGTPAQPAHAIGAFLFEIDPNDYLFPEIQSWPTPSPTGETLLVRREGDEVVYLNALRHQSNTALRLRFKLSDNPILPAARAALGEVGVYRGVDYRHVPVVAAIRSVNGSPWFIVAKQDTQEIHAPVRQWAWLIALGTTILIVAASLGVILVWRTREAQFARRELAERQHSEAALARKNQELENLIYAASHDLRSPLVNIEGFSRRLEKSCRELTAHLETTGDPAAANQKAAELMRLQIPKSLNYIRAGVARMNGLISGLLQLSRLGQVTLRPQELDMNRIIEQLTAAMAYQIQKTGALVQHEDLLPCQGDLLLVTQVFSNLLDNAIKYRDPSRPLVIRVSSRSDGAQRIYCVADTGIGIAREAQHKIWELFHRINPSGTPGEGLGLNLVHRILDRHDGHAWVESTFGEGSRFFVSFPETPLASAQSAAPIQNQNQCLPTTLITT